jgi:uncharacterized protein YndB with AHSA1/START domain
MTTETTETRIGQAVARTDKQALTFTMLREFAAPRERVFDAFSTCEALTHWLSPADWSLPFCEMDFREGGSCRYTMRAPAGTIGPNGEDPWDASAMSHYLEIVRPERLRYRDTFVDADGEHLPGMPEMHVTMRFIDLGNGRTSLVNTTQFASVEDLEAGVSTGMAEGWAGSLDKLETYLAGAGRETGPGPV